MSDGSASDAPNAASDEDAMMQHVMTLIEDDENGTVLKILQHAGVVHPLDLLLCSGKRRNLLLEMLPRREKSNERQKMKSGVSC